MKPSLAYPGGFVPFTHTFQSPHHQKPSRAAAPEPVNTIDHFSE
jgi:hypothetical protein